MKTKLSAVLLLFFTMLLSGQAPFPNKDEIKQFMASKTCVVLEQDQFSSYNVFIKEAVKKYWTLTPYQLITVQEFNKMRRDPAYSFIVLTQTNYEKDKANTLYNFLNLLQGKNVSKLGELPEICAIPLSFAGEDDYEYNYKFGAILQFMQKHAQMISDDPSLTGRKYLKYYNDNIPKVRTRTILIKEEDLAPEISTIDKIKAIYPYDVKIVSEEEIFKAIQEKTPNTLILHKVGPREEKNAGLCFKMLIGTDDSDMYYYHQHKIKDSDPNGLLADDLKRLSK
ncbi:MAG TPA: hypothetical protein VMV47_05540 [Bacteroidales bacterium]|nr:hypothetical protein [Bacteroidales bacterium]